MDDEAEFEVFQIKPQRFTKWNALGLGFVFMGEVFGGLSEWCSTLSVSVAAHKLQKDEDRKFQEIMNGS